MKASKIKKVFLIAVLLNTVAFAKEQKSISPVIAEAINLFGLQFNTTIELVFSLLIFILLVGLTVIVIQNLTTAEKRYQNFLKENVEKLRNEDFELLVDNDMKKLRTSLISKAKRTSNKEKIGDAKKYEIATGELDLAIKLKSLMNNSSD